LTITTFGSETPIQRNYGITNIQLWDRDGYPRRYSVATNEKSVEPMQRSHLSADDGRFLVENDIQLSLSNAYIHPKILLGGSDVFTLLNNEQGAHLTLPTGLIISPSKLKYLVARRAPAPAGTTDVPCNTSTHQTPDHQSLSDERTDSKTNHDRQDEVEDPHHSEVEGLQPRETTTDSPTGSLDPSTTSASLVRRMSTPYPTTKQWPFIYHLETTVAKIQENSELLEQYHGTFMNQLALSIIEEVDPNAQPVGRRVRSLLDQAVITPQNETTKLRVVFDASAHRRGCSSLNSVLHRGPVILPSLYDILLRFRIGKIALTSDVEKAFLQVRLQPQDRDVTGLLWLHCSQAGVSADNIVTYRFTRVTFELSCSPFLLAGTINHNLKNYVDDKRFAKQLHENTYVDNVILTASSTTETSELYQVANEVFNEMNMNLPKFRSNREEVNGRIKRVDLSTRNK
uniref:Reverse transcriptase domain-containing protein n=1 Tax=Haemonchus placei TaxID=6290 RepID=A0A0N4WPR2_HAEPC